MTPSRVEGIKAEVQRQTGRTNDGGICQKADSELPGKTKYDPRNTYLLIGDDDDHRNHMGGFQNATGRCQSLSWVWKLWEHYS
jgi:hypothetical protein